ncbi:MAG: NAD(P)/FAD-dependent oxidoreductase [Acidobacteria bacterium]|nr:NAD(P)/FAD-dependent oxidoreductase [Acidobacteriota bacterium]
MNFDVIVIGAGAAGMFCAAEAGKRGRRTLLLEHNAQPGRKIIISGGGRCNFTNIHTTHENFVSANPHFCKSALAGYTPDDFIELVRSCRIEYFEKKLGQLFCRERSHQIVEMLMAECRKAKVVVKTNCSVSNVEKDDKFTIDTSLGSFKCESLVVATGGLSFPKIGATDLGYRIAKQFGLKMVGTRPSLVPLVFESGPADAIKLAGIAVDSEVSACKRTFRENILFTHRGLSGPAILQASNYWHQGEDISIDMLPGMDLVDALNQSRHEKITLAGWLGHRLPNRLVQHLVANGLPNKPIEMLTPKEISDVAAKINEWRVRFQKTEGWDKAEVTLGGVSTEELSSKTMEAKRVPGLYFIGEVVDVTGWLGGYNFQWAWASAHAAGKAV